VYHKKKTWPLSEQQLREKAPYKSPQIIKSNSLTFSGSPEFFEDIFHITGVEL
jgi:hypothetical protein